MKNLILALLISSSAFAAEKPRFEIPANAVTSDSLCTTTMIVQNKTDSGWSEWMQTEAKESALEKYWNQDGADFFFSEGISDGSEFISLVKIKNERLDDVTRKTTMETEEWFLENGNWESMKFLIERISRKENGVSRVIENKVNGQAKPYYWEMYNTQISEKQNIMTRVHTNPSVMNTESKKYSRYSITCLTTDR